MHVVEECTQNRIAAGHLEKRSLSKMPQSDPMRVCKTRRAFGSEQTLSGSSRETRDPMRVCKTRRAFDGQRTSSGDSREMDDPLRVCKTQRAFDGQRTSSGGSREMSDPMRETGTDLIPAKRNSPSCEGKPIRLSPVVFLAFRHLRPTFAAEVVFMEKKKNMKLKIPF